MNIATLRRRCLSVLYFYWPYSSAPSKERWWRTVLVAEMIAYCGLTCQTCPICLATKVENKEEQRKMRIGIVQQCREQYGLDFNLEEITDCDGCAAGGRLFTACKDCPIRKCAREKGLKNCAFCHEYPCKDLHLFFQTEPAAKNQLERNRKNISPEGE